jgi:EAL and modified HD-GYP domain-containing signal transduction protein
MSAIHIARQPIFELGRGLYGYELLYRRDTATDHPDATGGGVTPEVLSQELQRARASKLSNDLVAFVKLSRDHLVSESWQLFDRQGVVIELLEGPECDRDTLAACQRMVQSGYKLALDEFALDARTRPLLDIASVVQVDALGRPHSELRAITAQVRASGARMLAKRVETTTLRDACVDLGYELFQGYLFSRPALLTKTDISASHLAIVRLLNLLRRPETPDDILDEAFNAEIALSYKLLRVVNAAGLGGRRVTSIAHAARVVGHETLYRWLAVILIESRGRRGDLSRELALTAITRARMCELLASSFVERRHPGSAFLVGVFSLLDVLLDVPMRRILARLEVSNDLRAALLERAGPLAAPLQLVEAYENANWDTAMGLASTNAVPDKIVPDLYLDALRWAAQQIAA